MEDIVYLRTLRLGGIAYQLTSIQFASQPREIWSPAINAFRCSHGFVVCVDLAGVDRSLIDLRVEPRRLFISGQRHAAEPDDTAGPPVQILALEIDHGPFEREIALPSEVDPEKAQAEQRNGLLWIFLPSQGQLDT